MSKDPKAHGQQVELVRKGTPTDMAANVEKLVSQMVGDPNAMAGTLLFPKDTSLANIVEVTLALGRAHGWNVTQSKLLPPPLLQMVVFAVSRKIPFAGAHCPSEVLVLGPYPEFPPTRTAPVPAMEIFVGPPMPRDPKSGQPSKKANLAHIEMPFPSPEAFQKAWDGSITGRQTSLGTPDDNRAKAKVAFVIPMELATQLGCAPP